MRLEIEKRVDILEQHVHELHAIINQMRKAVGAMNDAGEIEEIVTGRTKAQGPWYGLSEADRIMLQELSRPERRAWLKQHKHLLERVDDLNAEEAPEEYTFEAWVARIESRPEAGGNGSMLRVTYHGLFDGTGVMGHLLVPYSEKFSLLFSKMFTKKIPFIMSVKP